jgi:hypothetical protein
VTSIHSIRRAFSSRPQFWIDVLIGFLAISPLLLTAHIPLVDLPNHLARQYILRDVSTSNALQSFYFIKLELAPNLALEIFVYLARQVMSIEAAMRLFCIATILLLYAGTRFVNRTLSGPDSRLYRFAPFLCYGGPFQFGFLSYCFGIGVALMLFALYLRWRGRPLWFLLALFLPCGFGLILCHMAAFGIWALAIGAAALSEARAVNTRAGALCLIRSLLPAAAFLVPPLFIVVVFGQHAQGGLQMATLHEKIGGLAAITFFSSPVFEFALWGLAAAGLGLALYTGALRTQRITLVMLAVMTLIFLILPRSGGDTGYIDYRMPWGASFFILAALMPGQSTPRIEHSFRLFFTTLAAARLGLIAFLWLGWEPVIARIADALQTLPVGAKLMVVEGDPHMRFKLPDPAFTHVAAYAVAYRQAFEPSLFASLGGQILFFQPPYLAQWMEESPSALDTLDPLYSHLLVLRPHFAHIGANLALRCLVHGPDFALFAAVPEAHPGEIIRCGLTPAH